MTTFYLHVFADGFYCYTRGKITGLELKIKIRDHGSLVSRTRCSV